MAENEQKDGQEPAQNSEQNTPVQPQSDASGDQTDRTDSANAGTPADDSDKGRGEDAKEQGGPAQQ